MKLICIKSLNNSITKDNTYDIHKNSIGFMYIIDDEGMVFSLGFDTIIEYPDFFYVYFKFLRDKNLNEILN